MSSIKTWAENEIELAKIAEGDCEYALRCYDSALKAYNTLLEDEHSGMSWGLTFNILTRLARGLPLTPITDLDFGEDKEIIHEGKEYLKEHGLKSNYQCPRKTSLFRKETLDGRVYYTDVDRWFACDVSRPTVCYHSSLVTHFMDELYPITMPYYPAAEPNKVFVEEFLTDRKNGDFDTVAIKYAIINGKKKHIGAYFKQDVGDNEWVKITWSELMERKERRIDV